MGGQGERDGAVGEDEGAQVALGLGKESLVPGRIDQIGGGPPLDVREYLTRWRMQLAARRLADGDAKVSAVALDVGYYSEAAFSRFQENGRGAAGRVAPPPRAERDAGTPAPALSSSSTAPNLSVHESIGRL